MTVEIVLRLAITAALIGLGLGSYWSWNQWQLRRLRRRRTGVPGLESLRPGLPAVLYFTTPDCIPCRTTQRPALARLKTELAGGVQVVEVDAAARPAVADYWGVLSVPTTFILDPTGQPRRVNHGVTSTEKLKGQLEEITGRREKEAGRSENSQRLEQPSRIAGGATPDCRSDQLLPTSSGGET